MGFPGPVGPTGSTGATGAQGLGLAFTRVNVAASGELTLPSDGSSVVYMISPLVSGNTQVLITLPPASSATSRVITLRRGNTAGKVVLRPGSSDVVEGWKDPTQRLDDRFDYITLTSDGASWFVVAMNVK